MATYYYEGAKIVTPFSVVSNEPHFDMTTISLKIQRASQGYQRWELSFNTVNTSETAVDALLAATVDVESTKTMVMPQITTHSLTAEPDIAADADVGDTSVSVDLSSASGTLNKGTFIKFDNDTKVYIVKEDVDMSGSSGSAIVKIYPELHKALTNANIIKLDSNCILSYKTNLDNMMGITYTDGILSSAGTINLIEAV